MSQYLADQNGQAYADALHVVFIGGNDVAEAIGAYLLLFQQDPGQAQGVLEWIIGNAVTSTFANALELRQAGAKRFLLILAPNVGYSPLFEAARPFSPLVGAGAANGFNCAIAGDGVTRTCAPSSNPTLVQVLQASGAEVNLLDSQALFDAIIANSAVYGLTNTTDHCIQPNVPPYQCTNEDEYVYWDNIHPTGRIHEIIGQAAAAVFAD